MAARPNEQPQPGDALLDEVAEIVRRATGIDGARLLPVDEPLGALGLDSLSLVNAVAAVEQGFERELPDELWEDRRGISIASLAAAVAAHGSDLAAIAPPAPLRSEPGPPAEQPGVSRIERVFAELEGRGAAGRGAAHALHRAVIGAHWARSRQTLLVLERELGGPLPEIALPTGVTIGPYDGVSDAPLAGLWTGTQSARMRAHLRRRMARGVACLAAWEDGCIVAFDLLAPSGAEDVSTRPGTCLGLGLYERRSSRGRGIGLALLAASLPAARALGCTRQATIVLERNRPMIAASTQILGFAITGRAHRDEQLGRVTWSWQVHGSAARGPRLFI